MLCVYLVYTKPYILHWLHEIVLPKIRKLRVNLKKRDRRKKEIPIHFTKVNVKIRLHFLQNTFTFICFFLNNRIKTWQQKLKSWKLKLTSSEEKAVTKDIFDKNEQVPSFSLSLKKSWTNLSYKKQKDSLKTRAVLLIFSLKLEFPEWLHREYIKKWLLSVRHVLIKMTLRLF